MITRCWSLEGAHYLCTWSPHTTYTVALSTAVMQLKFLASAACMAHSTSMVHRFLIKGECHRAYILHACPTRDAKVVMRTLPQLGGQKDKRTSTKALRGQLASAADLFASTTLESTLLATAEVRTRRQIHPSEVNGRALLSRHARRQHCD